MRLVLQKYIGFTYRLVSTVPRVSTLTFASMPSRIIFSTNLYACLVLIFRISAIISTV